MSKQLSTVNKKRFWAAVTLAAYTITPAFAADIDVSEVAASLKGLIVPIGVVGAAYLTVRVAIRGWKVIRGVI